METIRQQGPITIEQYMTIVLQHPEHGYYRHGNPIGKEGDFGTAPEISHLFGETLALWCVDARTKLGCPEEFAMLELGPGQATLLHDILRSTKAHAAFHDSAQLHLLETSETLRRIQEQRLAPYAPRYISDVNELPPLPAIVIANEFFDNLPIRQFVKTGSGCVERLIGARSDRLIFVHSDESRLPEFVADELDNVEDGWVYEFSSQSQVMMQKLAAHIVKFGGFALVIDYGYVVPDGKSTLHGWHRHKRVDILELPGAIDVTAHVDFSGLARVARQEGAQVLDVVTQGVFLRDLGIEDRARLTLEAAPQDAAAIADTLYRLLDSPRMGELFKAMVIHSR